MNIKRNASLPILCSCGLAVSPGQQARHQRSHWHRISVEATAMRAQGVSYADIARHFGLTRAYISQKFNLIAGRLEKEKTS